MAKTFNERVSSVLNGLLVSGRHDVAAVTKLAKSIKGRADNLDVDMHAAGVAGLGCALEHRNTSALVAVINALGKHTRAKAFASWVENHSNIVLTLDKKTGLWVGKIVPADERKDDETLKTLMAKALAEPFWSVEEKSATDFSLHAALRALLKKAETAKAKGTLSDDDKVALVTLADLTDKVKPAPVEAPKADTLETVG